MGVQEGERKRAEDVETPRTLLIFTFKSAFLIFLGLDPSDHDRILKSWLTLLLLDSQNKRSLFRILQPEFELKPKNLNTSLRF